MGEGEQRSFSSRIVTADPRRGLRKGRGKTPLPDVRIGNAEELEVGIDLPAVEVAHEPHRRGMRRPFAEDPMRGGGERWRLRKS